MISTIAGLAMASCEKNYTCTCTATPPGSSTPATKTFEIKDVTRSNAKKTCEQNGAVYMSWGGTCEIK